MGDGRSPVGGVLLRAVGFDPLPYTQMSAEQQDVVAAFITAHAEFES